MIFEEYSDVCFTASTNWKNTLDLNSQKRIAHDAEMLDYFGILDTHCFSFICFWESREIHRAKMALGR